MKAILKREANAYFDSMTGYVFIAFLVAAVGIYFYLINLLPQLILLCRTSEYLFRENHYHTQTGEYW